jgi:hypothetical protein
MGETIVTDEVFTRIAGKLLTGMRDLVDWGIEEGHTTPAAGKSQRAC